MAKEGLTDNTREIIGEVTILYGDFWTNLIDFIIVVFVMFITVKAVNASKTKEAPKEPKEPN
ncbi:MscL family protein [Polaribacter sp. IC066]|uniref:MscL family protein n=1 Tax=Polaribacter sp. IC066 TaxID=57032 RepID=UPI002938F232|nr:MscL family protein [Polaribacter sp. IC066]